jgi:hypothetical protein
MMSYIDPNARKAVNDAIVNTGAKGVGQIVGTANSSVFTEQGIALYEFAYNISLLPDVSGF